MAFAVVFDGGHSVTRIEIDDVKSEALWADIKLWGIWGHAPSLAFPRDFDGHLRNTQ